MLVEEFKNEFNIGYNSIATMSSPSIDDYELSVYFTKAQLELVKDYYNPKGNKYQSGFENSEKRRTDLKELVKDVKIVDKIITTSGISANSQFFKIPSDVFLTVFESANFKDATCEVEKNITVYPKTHDEYNIQIENPFKNPDNRTIWRVNSSRISGLDLVELIASKPLGQYNLRYIKYPRPIIVSNLNTEFPGEGLSIDGDTLKTECELNEGIHREIIDRAIELALRDYKPEGLASKAQLDQRNE